jgi:UDP-glucose 4-epimerase
MVWLVTGGAGYIGAHVVRELIALEEKVLVLDDLSSGSQSNIPKNVDFVKGSIADTDILHSTMSRYQVSGIINLAGLKSVEESEMEPEKYESINHLGVQKLINSAKLFDVKYFIQSSTAAVYGNSPAGFVSETDELFPISPYGKTKSRAEDALNEAIDSNSLVGVSLRYFNVLGSSTPELKDRSTANIVPMVLESLSTNKAPRIFGDDYTTHDGTCIRDYVHVEDIARAHALAVMKLRTSNLPKAINIGTGTGFSVREIMTEILKQSHSTLEPVVVERRQGDPPMLVAKVRLAKDVLGFEAKKTLEEMIASSI